MKQKKKVSNVMLVLIIVAIVVYTAAEFLVQYLTGTEISPTLTTSWFAFWTVEIVALAAIKTSKVKHGYDKTCDHVETESCDNCTDDTKDAETTEEE